MSSTCSGASHTTGPKPTIRRRLPEHVCGHSVGALMKYSQNRGKVLNVQDARTSSSLGREMPLKPPRARATTHPVLSGLSRQKRAAKIVGIVDQPRRVHRYVVGLSASALSLSIVAVAVTCPTFNSEHADTQPAVERLNVPIPQLARRAPNSSPVEAQTELTDKKLSEIDTAVAELEKEPEASLPSAGDATGSLDTVRPAGHEAHTKVQPSLFQRRARTRPVASSIAKDQEVPTWSAKMYDGNWQPKAFVFR